MKKTIYSLLLLTLALVAPNGAQAAKMALSPASGTFSTGCPTALNIIVNTEGQDTMAADAFLRYNPNEVEIVDQLPGVAGVQIRPGSVYESYPGNVSGNGMIRLTAFNRQGYYNGRGVLGSIVIKAKPGVTASAISFDFSPGRTTDSNVAFVDSSDILNGAYGGTYTFKPGQCGGDSTPPAAEEMSPAPGEMNIPLDSKVSFVLTDNLAGVDINSLRVNINGILYTKEGEHRVEYEGKPNKYTISIRPVAKFLDREPVVVRINGQDLGGNMMQERKYSFNEYMPVTACGQTTATEAVRPSAPETRGITSWWPWWFVLLCSLILNLKLWTNRQKVKRATLSTIKFGRMTFGILKKPTKNKKLRK